MGGVVYNDDDGDEASMVLKGVVRAERLPDPVVYIASLLRRCDPKHIVKTYDVPFDGRACPSRRTTIKLWRSWTRWRASRGGCGRAARPTRTPSPCSSSTTGSGARSRTSSRRRHHLSSRGKRQRHWIRGCRDGRLK